MITFLHSLKVNSIKKSFFGIRRIAVKFSLKDLNTAREKFALDKLFELGMKEGFNDLDLDYVCVILSTKRSLGG